MPKKKTPSKKVKKLPPWLMPKPDEGKPAKKQ
jgi:hypothetical protein